MRTPRMLVRNRTWSIPPLAERLAMGRPVLAQEQMHDLGKHILSMSNAPFMDIRMTNTARVSTRLANGQVLSGDDGDTLQLVIRMGFSGEIGNAGMDHAIQLNQPDLAGLQAAIDRCAALAKERMLSPENVNPIKGAG
jgi:hypothetical protein